MISLLRFFRLFPDVMTIDHDGEVRLCRSFYINGRRFAKRYGYVVQLKEDGKVQGRAYIARWEEL